MSAERLTPEWVQELRAEAYRIRTSEGVKHHEVMQRLAEREGFKNWMALLRAIRVSIPEE